MRRILPTRIYGLPFRPALICVLLPIILLGLILGSSFISVKLQAKPIRAVGNIQSDDIPGIQLHQEVLDVDVLARTLTISWWIMRQNCSIDALLNIYVDYGNMAFSSPNYEAENRDDPVITHNIPSWCQEFPTIRDPNPSFTTVSKVFTFIDEDSQSPSLRNYPWDAYYARVRIYALNNETGAVVEARGYGANDDALNFQITYDQENPGFFYYSIKRPAATRVFVLTMVVISWAVALVFMTICISSVLFRHHKIYAEMFVAPISALFAFTSVRVNLPGVPPGFGLNMDMYCTLPVLAILGISSVFLLFVVLYRRILEIQVQPKEDKSSFLERQKYPESHLSIPFLDKTGKTLEE